MAKATKKAAKAAKKATKKATKKVKPPVDRLAKDYDQAVTLLNGRRFAKALPLFESIAEAGDSVVGHSAGMYARICRERLSDVTKELKTADDHYNYAVKLLNDRDLDGSKASVERAIKLDSKNADAHYVRAVVAALRSDATQAWKSLGRAIELNPSVRLTARRDSDLAGVVDDSRIASLLEVDNESAEARS